MAARLNARIDAVLAKKVAKLRRLTRRSTTEVVREALERYYESVERDARPYDALRDGGLIGCAEGPADLSSNYKAAFADSLAAKVGGTAPKKARAGKKA